LIFLHAVLILILNTNGILLKIQLLTPEWRDQPAVVFSCSDKYFSCGDVQCRTVVITDFGLVFTNTQITIFTLCVDWVCQILQVCLEDICNFSQVAKLSLSYFWLILLSLN